MYSCQSVLIKDIFFELSLLDWPTSRFLHDPDAALGYFLLYMVADLRHDWVGCFQRFLGAVGEQDPVYRHHEPGGGADKGPVHLPSLKLFEGRRLQDNRDTEGLADLEHYFPHAPRQDPFQYTSNTEQKAGRKQRNVSNKPAHKPPTPTRRTHMATSSPHMKRRELAQNTVLPISIIARRASPAHRGKGSLVLARRDAESPRGTPKGLLPPAFEHMQKARQAAKA